MAWSICRWVMAAGDAGWSVSGGAVTTALSTVMMTVTVTLVMVMVAM
ncbi:hypothetical protein ACFXAZ_39080 [Streptomyces sp. NPDC059477]